MQIGLANKFLKPRLVDLNLMEMLNWEKVIQTAIPNVENIIQNFKLSDNNNQNQMKETIDEEINRNSESLLEIFPFIEKITTLCYEEPICMEFSRFRCDDLTEDQDETKYLNNQLNKFLFDFACK